MLLNVHFLRVSLDGRWPILLQQRALATQGVAIVLILLLHDLGQHAGLARLGSILVLRVATLAVVDAAGTASSGGAAQDDVTVAGNPTVPLLITLNENGNAPVVGILLLLLHHDSARVLFKRAAVHGACELGILAVVGVVGHIPVLAAAVLEGLRLVGTEVVGLTLHIFDIAGSHEVATLLNELVLDLAQITVQDMVLAHLRDGLIDRVRLLVDDPVVQRKLLGTVSSIYFPLIRQHVFGCYRHGALVVVLGRLSLGKAAGLLLLLECTLVELDDSAGVLVDSLSLRQLVALRVIRHDRRRTTLHNIVMMIVIIATQIAVVLTATLAWMTVADHMPSIEVRVHYRFACGLQTVLLLVGNLRSRGEVRARHQMLARLHSEAMGLGCATVST